jgi:all-trans-retinol 13,14-reductase
MTDSYDAITIGSGLGALTAAALYARAGHRVLILERNDESGGAATTYRHGRLTMKPRYTRPRAWPIRSTPRPAHHKAAFRRFFERMAAVREAMSVVGKQHDSLWWFLHAPVLPLKLWPLLRDTRLSLSEVFDRLFGDDEAPKLALAANLDYYADDPARLWWVFYAIPQGSYVASGGTYIRGGSGVLSRKLVGAVQAEGGAARSARTVTEITTLERPAVDLATRRRRYPVAQRLGRIALVSPRFAVKPLPLQSYWRMTTRSRVSAS